MCMELKSVKNKLLYLMNKIKYCGKNISFNDTSHISPNAELKCVSNSHIFIGPDVSLSSGCLIQTADRGSIEFKGKTFINKNCFFVSREGISIGTGCTFGPNVIVYDHDHGLEWNKRNEYKTAQISIGDNCWIAANCIILKGSIIGNNCVIGAGTIVNGVIPNNSVAYNEKHLAIKPIENITFDL